MKIRTLTVAALAAASCGFASAQETFLGTVEEFPFNFCPRGWAPAEGQLLPINENTALFSLLGTQYGGDGRTTFALPDLRKKAPAAPAATQKAEIFQHCNFSGWSVSLSPGNYPLSSLTGFKSNDMSSIKLPAGWGAKLYDGDTLNGSAIDIGSTDACLVDNGFNDKASSLVITGTSSPAPAETPTDSDKFKPCIATVGIYPSRN